MTRMEIHTLGIGGALMDRVRVSWHLWILTAATLCTLAGCSQGPAPASQEQVDSQRAVAKAEMEKGIAAMGGHLPKGVPTGTPGATQ